MFLLQYGYSPLHEVIYRHDGWWRFFHEVEHDPLDPTQCDMLDLILSLLCDKVAAHSR